VPDIQHPIDAPLPLEPDTTWLMLDDTTIGLHFWAWFLSFVLGKWGIDLAKECRQNSLEQVYENHEELFRKLPTVALDLDQDDVQGVLLQKAGKFCARGELARAGNLIREFIELREEHNREKAIVDAGKARQRKRAKKPRPTPFSKRLDAIVLQMPDISEAELLSRLMSETGDGLIESVDETNIVWLDNKGNQKITKMTYLKDALSKAKKRFRHSRAKARPHS